MVLWQLMLVCSPSLVGSRRKEQEPSLEHWVAASTEDLARLAVLERQLWGLVQGEVLRGGESQVNLTHWTRVLEDEPLQCVSDPMEAFQVLKRTTGQWQSLLDSLPSGGKGVRKARRITSKFPERADFEYGAAVGVMALQLYYNIPYQVSWRRKKIVDRRGRKRWAVGIT